VDPTFLKLNPSHQALVCICVVPSSPPRVVVQSGPVATVSVFAYYAT